MKTEILEVLNKNSKFTYQNNYKEKFIEDVDFEKVAKELDALFAKRIVGRSVWIVQDKHSLVNHGLFSTKQKAEKFINGSNHMAIRKVEIG